MSSQKEERAEYQRFSSWRNDFIRRVGREPMLYELWASINSADGDGPNNCEVCGDPVRYGSRHHQCGSAVEKAVKEALALAQASGLTTKEAP